MNRNMPSKKKIKEHWKQIILIKKSNIFDSVEHFDSGDYCFACGLLTNYTTERAHILARVVGGTNEVNNLHLLCSACHKDSEMLEGKEYWDWFINRSIIDTMLHIFYKHDYDLFKSFRSDCEKMSLDFTSKEAIDSFNCIRSIFFDIGDNKSEKFKNIKEHTKYQNSIR